MKKIKLSIAALLITSVGFAQTQCTATTKKNVQCKNTVKTGILCYLHNPNYVKSNNSKTIICNGTTKNNTKCKNKTKHTSGLCHHHRKNK